MVYGNATLATLLMKSTTGVILPVDAGATCTTGSDVPKSASINPPK
jgi:hypothetical protein